MCHCSDKAIELNNQFTPGTGDPNLVGIWINFPTTDPNDMEIWTTGFDNSLFGIENIFNAGINQNIKPTAGTVHPSQVEFLRPRTGGSTYFGTTGNGYADYADLEPESLNIIKHNIAKGSTNS